MYSRNYQLFIQDIIEAIDKIENYTINLSFDEFSKNNMVKDAVIRNFEIIGEAANNIPEDIRNKYPEVEWKECIGFRNFLIHGYFSVSLNTIWDTIHNNLPTLKKHIKEIKGF